MKKAAPFREFGFSMVEIMIVLLVLSGGLLTVGKFQGELYGSNALAKQRTEATLLAQQKLEELRGFVVLQTASLSAANIANTDKAFQQVVTGNDAVTGISAVYTRAWTVTASTVPADNKQVNITVGWTDKLANAQSVVLNTVIAANELKNSGLLITNTTSATVTTSSSSTSTTGATTTSTTVSTSSTAATTTTTSSTTSTTLTPARVISGAMIQMGSANMTKPSVSGGLGVTCITTTSSYTCSVPNGWTGTITASEGPGNDGVTPASYVFAVAVTADVSGYDFTVFKGAPPTTTTTAIPTTTTTSTTTTTTAAPTTTTTTTTAPTTTTTTTTTTAAPTTTTTTTTTAPTTTTTTSTTTTTLGSCTKSTTVTFTDSGVNSVAWGLAEDSTSPACTYVKATKTATCTITFASAGSQKVYISGWSGVGQNGAVKQRREINPFTCP